MNVRGLTSKRESIYDILLTNDIDVCLINETWLKREVPSFDQFTFTACPDKMEKGVE